tara:strand:- start:1539 stop:2522 length:984 start_codon:yes stop_codon:yes gene_type:complete
MADIQLDFPHDINVSVQLGDLVYFTPTTPVGTFGNWASTTTPHDTAPKEDIILMGPVIEFIPWNGNNINQMLTDGVHFNTINTSLALPNSGAALNAVNVIQQAVNTLDTLGQPGTTFENETPFIPGTWYRFSDQSTDPITFVEEITNTGTINFPSTIVPSGQGATGIIQLLAGLIPGTTYEVILNFTNPWGSINIDFYDGTTSLNTGGLSGQGIGGNVNIAQNIHTFTAPSANLTVVFSQWNNFGGGGISNISIRAVEQSSIIADYDDAIAAIHGPPSEGDFIMFSKDNKVNLSSLLGYYSLLKLGNNSTSKAEMFSVGANFIESSK